MDEKRAISSFLQDVLRKDACGGSNLWMFSLCPQLGLLSDCGETTKRPGDSLNTFADLTHFSKNGKLELCSSSNVNQGPCSQCKYRKSLTIILVLCLCPLRTPFKGCGGLIVPAWKERGGHHWVGHSTEQVLPLK